MPLIDLDTAVDHIRQACEDNRESGRTPFFFLVGAGISSPPIPLALEIISHCKTVAQQYNRINEPSGIKPLDIYSHWFHQAYPQPIQRQKYLRNLIEGKSISPANFRLAHLLLDKTITNLVVTTNFDDFLSRALTLFGKQHIVCDHPNTVGRIDPEHNDIQIVHVHGTYWFYDCCNLRGEIETRSQSSEYTTMTMSSLLDRVLSRRSPIVFGYGGWEGDVIMTALKRRLEYPLPYNLYWVCYQQNKVDSLPEWLKSHHQIYFVIPPQKESTFQNVEERHEPEYITKKLIKSIPHQTREGFSIEKTTDPTLSEYQVLDKLIQKFELKAPELTSDPLNFFAKHLRHSLLHDNVGEMETDIYYLSSVIERIERANQKYIVAIKGIESRLESVRDAMRRLQYREAIKLALEIDKEELQTVQLSELMDAMWLATSELDNKYKEKIHGYDIIIAIGEKLLKQKNNDPDILKRVVRAIINKGITFSYLNCSEESIVLYDDVIYRLNKVTEPTLREWIAKALVVKGNTLSRLSRNKEAIAAYDEVIKQFGGTAELSLCVWIARALISKGYSLDKLNQCEEAIKTYDEVVTQFGAETDINLRGRVAWALITKGYLLGKLNRYEEAVTVYDEVVKKFGMNTEPNLRDLVLEALIIKVSMLDILDRNENAIDEKIKRRLNMIIILLKLQRFNEAQHFFKQFTENSVINLQIAKDFLSDLELLTLALQPPEGIQQFLEQARKILVK